MKRLTKCLTILISITICSWTLLFFWPISPLLSNASYSRAIYDKDKHLLRLTLSHDSKYRLYTPLSDISPLLIEATLLQEDQYFYWHAGINPVSLVKAIWQTYVSANRRIGASTISMQVAHIHYGINSKTVLGKIKQIIRALQIEMHYSKDEILEAYLNLAPYGNNIEGVGAASLIYFDKSAHQLSLPELLTLVVIPQNPTKRVLDRGELKEIRNKLYLRWIARHPKDNNNRAMMYLPLQMKNIRHATYLAPHFVNSVLANTATNKDQIVTTLDLHLQKLIEHVTKNYISRKSNFGVNNAAVLLVDTRDMSIKAMLGSADFFNQSIGGQINGTKIKRSPGSTLKPFIYALAIDQGLIHPATVLKDVSRSFGSYNPENFDYDFVGPITAKDALILSRNIPAVYLADQLKHPSLYEFLHEAHVNDMKSETYYGLALVLGGAEITMQELIGLYATLANDGVWKPVRSIAEYSEIPSKRLLSSEASFLVLDMLKDTPQTNHHYGVSPQQSMQVAWKTGTSSGYRDAWTVGIFGHYALAVWIGNFNNQSNQAFVGKSIAAPLFFDIANAINKQYGPLADFQKPTSYLHLTKVEVCKASGLLPTRYCQDKQSVWFIPGKSPIKTDTIYREVAINKKTGLRTCDFNADTRFEIYEFWSSDLLKIFNKAGIQRRIPPPYDATCNIQSQNKDGLVPQIVSPQVQVKYMVQAAKQTVIPFNAVVDADVRYLHWFLNETYVGKTTRDQSFLWQARPGNYVVRVVDDYGRSDARDIKVKLES